MATIEQMNQEEQNQGGSAQSGVIGGTGGGATPMQQAQPTTGFVNLQNYLGANQEGSRAMGEGVSSGIKSEAEKIATQGEQQAEAFKKQVQGKTFGDVDLKGINWGNQEQVGNVQKALGQEGVNVAQEKQNWANTAANLNQQLGAVESRAKGLENTAGRQAELGRKFGQGGGYTQGMSALDAFLLGGQNLAPAVQSTVSSQQSRLGNLTGNVGQTVENQAAQFEAARQGLQGRLGQEYGQTFGELNTAAVGSKGNQIQILKNQGYTDDEISKIVNPNYGVADIASPEQLAKLRALESLTGRAQTQTTGSLVNQAALEQYKAKEPPSYYKPLTVGSPAPPETVTTTPITGSYNQNNWGSGGGGTVADVVTKQADVLAQQNAEMAAAALDPGNLMGQYQPIKQETRSLADYMSGKKSLSKKLGRR